MLQIDPEYVDAKLVVGVYEYVVGALPFPFKISDWLRRESPGRSPKAWKCCGMMRNAEWPPMLTRAR